MVCDRADSSVDVISENLVASLSKNVRDIVAGIVSDVDTSLASEVCTREQHSHSFMGLTDFQGGMDSL
ncbi:hypothetical protein Pelo_12830 [Pelomyxa schiedti]|nr:hypothetical protein Pelo_12830 [Pelomyxa schiedti]